MIPSVVPPPYTHKTHRENKTKQHNCLKLIRIRPIKHVVFYSVKVLNYKGQQNIISGSWIMVSDTNVFVDYKGR